MSDKTSEMLDNAYVPSSKAVFQTDADGYLVGETTADESPLEPGVFLMPAGAVEVEPPVAADGKRNRWNGTEWTQEEIPQPEEPAQPDPVEPDYLDLRRAEYPPESDQLDAIMKWVAHVTMSGDPMPTEELESMAARCMAIKKKYPKPE